MITLYGIANCDTMKKTRQWLDQQHANYQFHDYRKQGLDEALAREFLQHVELDQLINRRGTTWRQLPDSSKAALSADAGADINNIDSIAALLVAHPAMIKRPLLRGSAGWVVGFDTAAMQALISNS